MESHRSGATLWLRGLAERTEIVVYVSTNDNQVYAVVDRDGDGQPEHATTILQGYSVPLGLAWRQGSLFVGQVDRILRLDNIDQYALSNKAYDKAPAVVFDALPTDGWHGAKYIALSPDGRHLFVPIGVPCNICKPGTYQKNATTPVFQYGSIYRLTLGSSGGVSKVQLWASGIRNSVGMDWHPDAKTLFFTDNGRDDMGENYGNQPDDELNYAPSRGLFFGYPYCHTTGVGGPDSNPYQRGPGVGRPLLDPDENPDGKAFNCRGPRFTPAIQAMGPHVASLGMRFYRWELGRSFPRAYDRSILIAQHGSWNRPDAIGYRVMRAVLDIEGTRVVKYVPFATGWLKPGGDVAGRPVDVLQLRDGSVLISDDAAGCVYRVAYKKP